MRNADDELVGVKLKCFACGTNTHVTPPSQGKGFKPISDKAAVRTIHGYKSNICIIRGRYCCSNPTCPEVIKNASEAGIAVPDDPKAVEKLGLSHSFESCDPEVHSLSYLARYTFLCMQVMRMLPVSVQQKYPAFIGGQKGFSDDIVHDLLNSDELFAQMAATIKASCCAL